MYAVGLPVNPIPGRVKGSLDGSRGKTFIFRLDAISTGLLFNRPISLLDRSKGDMSRKYQKKDVILHTNRMAGVYQTKGDMSWFDVF